MAIFKFIVKTLLGFVALIFGLKTVFEAGEMTGAAKVAFKVKEEEPEAFDNVFMEDENEEA